MRLADFILEAMEKILVEWESFAKSLYPAGAQMSPEALRDHAREMLQIIAADLRTSQTAEDQALKSRGLLTPPEGSPESVAQTHAVLRQESGLDINQLASEYRALRASVLRLWNEQGELNGHSLRDVIRFNEAIDQALAESIAIFTEQAERSRNLLVGMLAHDMRSPLNAIAMTAENLADLSAEEEILESVQSLRNSGDAMKALLDDLVDFSRKGLGLGVLIEAKPVDLGPLCLSEVKQHRAAYPQCEVELKLEGNLQGEWDGLRVQQILRNLLCNATIYGTAGEPVGVSVTGEAKGVSIEVRNTGPEIEGSSIQRIFEPLRRGPRSHLHNKGMGLGLFIVREITRAHGGEITLHSDSEKTTFCVYLPHISKNTDHQ